MDLDTILFRRPLPRAPLALLLQTDDPAVAPQIIDRASRLLASRRLPDEIVVVARTQPLRARKHCSHVRRVHWLTHDSPQSGGALGAAIEICSAPIVILLDEIVSIEPDELRDMVARLSACDIVVGRRANVQNGWFRGPLDRLLCSLLGVAVSDPLCPILAFRTAVVRGLQLQCTAPLVSLEIVAKLTYLTCLLDEQPLRARASDRPRLLQTLLRHRRAFKEPLLRPRFWSMPSGSTPYRLPTHEAANMPYRSPPMVQPITAARRPRARIRCRRSLAMGRNVLIGPRRNRFA